MRTLDDEVFELRIRSLFGPAAAAQATDLTDRVTAALRQPQAEPGAAPAIRRSLTVGLPAAIVLLGLGIVTAMLCMDRASTRVATPAQGPGTFPPRWVDVWTAGDVAALADEARFVRGTNLDDTAVASLVRRANLEGLWLRAGRYTGPPAPRSLTPAGLASIARARALRHLQLDGHLALSGEALEPLSALRALEHLGITGFDTIDEHLAFVTRLPALRSLDLSQNHGFAAPGMTAIAAAPNLRRLALRGCRQLNDRALAALERATSLRELDLSGVRTMERSDGWFERAARASSPVSRPRDPIGIDAACLARIGRWGLESLALSNNELRDRDIEPFAESLRLRALDLSQNAKLELVPLGLPATLVELDLSGTSTSDEAAEAIRRELRLLRHVRVADCPRMTDIGVANLLGLERLQTLDITNCGGLSEFGLQILSQAGQIEEVAMGYYPWLTMDVIRPLLEAGIRIRWTIDEPLFGAETSAWESTHRMRGDPR